VRLWEGRGFCPGGRKRFRRGEKARGVLDKGEGKEQERGTFDIETGKQIRYSTRDVQLESKRNPFVRSRKRGRTEDPGKNRKKPFFKRRSTPAAERVLRSSVTEKDGKRTQHDGVALQLKQSKGKRARLDEHGAYSLASCWSPVRGVTCSGLEKRQVRIARKKEINADVVENREL